MTVNILQGDCRDRIRTLSDESINCCVTSPPYFGLRDYGVPPSIWGGNLECAHVFDDRSDCDQCGAWRGCLGLEPTPDLFVAHIVEVMREVRRVLRADGTLWLNIGDSYAGRGGRTPQRGKLFKGRERQREIVCRGARVVGEGLKAKDLMGIPWAVAFALRDDGWFLRQDIIWSKPNPMPESVTDRCTKAHEYLFLLSKSQRYYYDAAGIAEQLAETSIVRLAQDVEAQCGSDRVPGKSNGAMKAVGGHDDRRNKRSVWNIATQPYTGAHYATFPPRLVEPCLLAGAPAGGVVLDPFGGHGTTGLVADSLGRDAILIELNEADCIAARERIDCAAQLRQIAEQKRQEREALDARRLAQLDMFSEVA